MQTLLPSRIPAHRIRRVGLIGTLGLLVVAACVGSTRADQSTAWRVGDPHERPLPSLPADAARAMSEADGWARQLGIAGQAASARRVEDAKLREVAEVVELSAAGRVTAIISIEPASRRVRSVVRVDWKSDFDQPRVDAAKADAAARALARGFGITPPATPADVSWDSGMQAWEARWPRVIDGIEALGAGLVVHVHQGGQLKALRVFDWPHAPASLFRLEPAAATRAVERWTRSLRLERFADFRMAAPVLAWVNGNDFVDPGKPDAEDTTLRLAYVVRMSYRPTGWTSDHLTEIYVDAGSGELIGGAETS
jgi:hypothetical protein